MTATTMDRLGAKTRTETMMAMVQDRYGTADVLHLREIERPQARAGEVVVRVRAVSLDAGTKNLVYGQPIVVRAATGLLRPKNKVPGLTVAGIVDEVGPGVTDFRAGDEVYGWCSGSLAEYVSVAASDLLPKPAALPFVEAATAPISAITALQAVCDQAEVRAGQHVLVTGAAGGVGSFAVQIAKAYGAVVTGACRPSKAEAVRSIGADHVIDYTTEGLASGGRRYDAIIDTAGRLPSSELRRAMTPDGTLVVVGGEGGGRWLGVVSRLLWMKLIAPLVSQRIRVFYSVSTRSDLRAVGALIASGAVKPIIDRTYPLHEAAEALRYQASGEPRGKVVVSV